MDKGEFVEVVGGDDGSFGVGVEDLGDEGLVGGLVIWDFDKNSGRKYLKIYSSDVSLGKFVSYIIIDGRMMVVVEVGIVVFVVEVDVDGEERFGGIFGDLGIDNGFVRGGLGWVGRFNVVWVEG